MWIQVERTRQLVQHAARLGDSGDPRAPQALFAAKADVAEMATSVTQSAMVLSGGRGYARNSKIGRLLRDAQAAHVMAPTTQLLKTWLGRSLLDLPLL
jgi:alkylation response protein AidB-like acyl-CoA dehydrogenase